MDAEVTKVGRFDELRKRDAPVVGGIGCVICRTVIVIDEANKPGVLHAITLIQRDREDYALGERNRGIEIELVIGFHEPLHPFDRSLYVLSMQLGLVSCVLHRLIQFSSRKCSAQSIHHRPGPIIFQALLVQLVKKFILRKGGVGIDVSCGYEGSRLFHLDRMIASDNSTAKLDRRNMTLADGPKRQNEAKISGFEICLVRMRDDRWIEQCGGLNGIFSGEECSD